MYITNSLLKFVFRNNQPLYLSVCLHQCGQHPTKDQQQMRTILSEALFSVKTELDSLSPLSSQCETSPVTQVIKGDGDKALALLEQYAELLLKSVEKRLDNKS